VVLTALNCTTIVHFKFIWGPLPNSICTLNLYLKAAGTIQTFLFLDAIVISKYFLIFWLKNPFGCHDDFWNRFISIWIVVFSHLSQLVADFLPGKGFLLFVMSIDIFI
jgi:hypothetical protein